MFNATYYDNNQLLFLFQIILHEGRHSQSYGYQLNIFLKNKMKITLYALIIKLVCVILKYCKYLKCIQVYHSRLYENVNIVVGSLEA